MLIDFSANLPQGFYKPISSPIKTMDLLNKTSKTSKAISPLDLDSYFLRVLTLSQQRDISVSSLFKYEMCIIPPSLFDEYERLRKGTNASFVKQLGEVQTHPRNPEVVIIDAQQLIYHINWPL